MIELLLIALGFAAVTATGLCLLRALAGPESEEEPADLRLALAYPLGLGVLALSLSISLIVMKRVNFWIFPVGLAAAAALSFIGGNPLPGLLRWRRAAAFEEDSRPEVRWATRFFLLIAAIYLGMFLGETINYPLTGFDGRAIWEYKAKILFAEKTIYTETYTDPQRVHFHRNYPPLVPTAEYALYELIGRHAERRAKLVLFAFYAAFIFYFHAALRRRAGPLPAAILTALLCASGQYFNHLEGSTTSGSVDMPLGFMALAAACSLEDWLLRRRAGDLRLAAAFVGLTLLAKQEGLVVFGVFGLMGLVWAAAFPPKTEIPAAPVVRRIGPLLLAAAGAILVFLPWWIAVRPIPNLDEDYTKMLNSATLDALPGRVVMILASLGEMFLARQRWNYTWPAYGAALLLAALFRRRPATHLLDAIIVLWLFLYTAIYCLSPLNLDFHLATSQSRLVSHVYPLMLFRLGVLAAALWPSAAALEPRFKPAEAPSGAP